MQKQFAFFPGKLRVVFHKGPLGFLLQEPSDEAKRVSSTPQDKSAAMREDLVRQNALAVIRQRGGDPSDKMEVLGDYVLQFGKYKGKSFRWLLQNDVGSTVYLIKNVQSEEAAGLCTADSHSKDSLQSFVSYALSFQEIQALLTYEAGRGDGVTASSEDDQLVGFGARAKSRWKEIWDSRGDGYADFVTGRRCVPGTRMSRLQQNLLKRQQPTTSSTPAEHPMKAPAEPLAMEEDVEMEREMLSIHNSDLQVQSYAMPLAAAALPRVPPGAKTVPSATRSKAPPGDTAELQASLVDAVPASPGVKRKRPVPLPPQLAFLVTETEGLTKVEEPHSTSGPDSCTAQTSDGRVPPLTDSTQDQKSGMLNHPELLDMVAELPSPNFFQLHPFFIWKPESHIMVRLRNNDILPCLHSCPRPQVVSAGVGRPRVIVSVRGQYLIFSSRLCCKACRRNWSADNPPWVEKLPVRFTNLLPAFLTYKKAACKSVMDELRRSGKSPTDMANQVNELMHLKYERAHLAYLHAVQNVREAEAGAYGQRTMGQYVRMEDRPRAFGPYEDQEGWGGVSVSGFYLTDCLLDEFKRQQPSLTKLLQGTLGQVFRSDHTRKMARKVTLASGAMSSLAVMNENWLIVSWVMVQAETERSLHPM
ncbi:hypothetical protein D4764_04G0016010 [Takifugu flavidus]|uniref:DUF6729 domain-containing protein n=1 Tax=Takifugu flavidus TaxID=433684 RepID=A0A5C6N637_9TELE|nr:hypothetical protein D4764_04G0016010 [Takifugu flavidus]